MRLLRLDLLRYGAFENRSLLLRNDARLHVVFGRNEAGKSTTLSALSDLFFGFPHKTPQDFRFTSSELRIGGEILARSGERLAFIRRKGTRNTLLDSSDKALPDDALAPFLGGLSRDIFRQAFGLNAEALRSGAEDILKAEGEAGSSLMAAASGLRGLKALKDELEKEADRIFAARAAKDRRFYDAKERYEAARKAAGESELRSADLKRLRNAVSEAEERFEKLRQEDIANRREEARLSRLLRLAPAMRRLAAKERALAELPALPPTPHGFAARLSTALSERAALEARAQEATASHAQIMDELSRVACDETLLAGAGEIDALNRRIGRYRKDCEDVLKRSGEQAEALAALSRLAARLGLADVAALRAMRPTDMDIASLERLAREQREAAGRRAATSSRIEATRRELEEGRASTPVGQDPAPLREKLASLGNVEALAQAALSAERNLRREEETLRAEALKLSPAITDLDALAKIVLPSASMIEEMDGTFEAASQMIKDATRQAAEAEAECIRAQDARDAVSAGIDLPTPERIAAARMARDADWAALRALLFDAERVPAGEGLASMVASFETRGAEADRLADLAAREAERISRWNAECQRFNQAQARKEVAETALAQAREKAKALGAAWAKLWEGAGIAPLQPRVMSVWRSAVSGLLDRHAALSDLRFMQERSQRDLVACLAPLEALAQESGLAPLPGLDPLRLWGRIGERLGKLEAEWNAAREGAVLRENASRRLADLEQEARALDAAATEWAGRWARAVAALGLPADAPVEQAETALSIWSEAQRIEAKLGEAEHRIATMRRDIAQFEEDAAPVVTARAPALASSPPVDAVERLAAMLVEAQKDAARRDQIARQGEEAARAVARTEKDAADARERLAALIAVLDGAEPEAALQAITLRESFTTEAEAERRTVSELGEGATLDDIRRELETFDNSEAQNAAAVLAEERSRIDGDVAAAHTALADARRHLREREGGAGSEAAVQVMRNAEAEMQEAARDWIVRKLAASMLACALQQHRADRQDPLLASAGSIFSKLTGGGFSGVEIDDREEVAALVGRRCDGALTPVNGLSEGTRDQLYLALRLAWIMDYCERAEPAPFVADDLFSSFDDARTVHGLHALAACGERTQCILFTHHRHVADLAQAELGAAADVVEM